ncbi:MULTISPECIES: ATP-binding protein [unclassified Actinomyces]|uniref:ATP-binding protein n=1 Tax=unclassified Actinomyces TaxID=2609248 RepID=UPI001F21F9A2|nr:MULTISPECIES: ATP-binding protein [unclassified Actinomyces]
MEIRLTRVRLIISSPGGLWGLTVDQLGTRDGKSAVNERLYDICTFTTDADGRRMIEGLGTGIRAVREALRQADMEPVRFQDTGVRFTALLPRAALLSPSDLTWLADLDTEGLGVEQRHALAEMRHGRPGPTRPTGVGSVWTPLRPGDSCKNLSTWDSPKFQERRAQRLMLSPRSNNSPTARNTRTTRSKTRFLRK